MADEQEKKKDNPQDRGKEKLKADTANVLVSFLDRQVATWLREKVAPRAPEWMRSEAVLQLAGPFRSLIEIATGDRHWFIKTLGEKVGSDYPDMFFTILGGKPEKAASGVTKGASRLESFLNKADKRLWEAEDPAAEWERLKEQFRLQEELEALIEEARKAQEELEPEKEEPERKPLELKKWLYGTKKKPGPIPKAKEKAHRADIRTDRALRGMNRRLQGWLDERDA